MQTARSTRKRKGERRATMESRRRKVLVAAAPESSVSSALAAFRAQASGLLTAPINY